MWRVRVCCVHLGHARGARRFVWFVWCVVWWAVRGARRAVRGAVPGAWCVVGGGRCAVRGGRCAARGAWCVVCVWCVVRGAVRVAVCGRAWCVFVVRGACEVRDAWCVGWSGERTYVSGAVAVCGVCVVWWALGTEARARATSYCCVTHHMGPATPGFPLVHVYVYA